MVKVGGLLWNPAGHRFVSLVARGGVEPRPSAFSATVVRPVMFCGDRASWSEPVARVGGQRWMAANGEVAAA